MWYSQTMAGGVRRPSPPGGDTLALLDQESSGEIVSHATYARELRRRLPARCFGPVPARLWWLVPHLAVIVLGIAWIGMDNLGWLPSLGLALLLGTSFASLGFLGHEVLHGSVVRTPWLSSLVGGICFAPFNIGPRLWRKWHNAEHHGHTQQPNRDPDTVEMVAMLEQRRALRVFFRVPLGVRSFLTFASFAGWFSFHSFQMLRRYYRGFGRGRLVVLGQFLAPLSVWLALLVWLGPAKFLFAYLLPVMLANFLVMSYIATNHLLNPLAQGHDPLAYSLTVTVPRWVDVLHLNFSHHTEHHIFPKMSLKHAPLLKRHLRELWPDRYHEMPLWLALRALWRTPRLYLGHNALFDPPGALAYPVLGHGLDPKRIAGYPPP